MVRHELPGSETVEVAVHGLAGARTLPIPTPEEPGAFAFPPIAALITAAARLMLALLERSVTDAGGTYVMVDTDSMAVVSDERGSLVACPGGEARGPDGTPAVRALSFAQVEAIRRRFDRLNPYAPGSITDILKLEDHNFAATPTTDDPDAVDRTRRIQLHAFAVSAKRYALFERTTDGVLIRKPSEHGLGHLLNPNDPEDKGGRQWIRTLWTAIVTGRDPARALPFAGRPAVTRTSVSRPRLLRPFEQTATPGPYRVRPFNFLLSATIAPGGHPPSVADPGHFHLVARYNRDPGKWLRMRWLDRYSWRAFAVTTGQSMGDSSGSPRSGRSRPRTPTTLSPSQLGPTGGAATGGRWVSCAGARSGRGRSPTSARRPTSSMRSRRASSTTWARSSPTTGRTRTAGRRWCDRRSRSSPDPTLAERSGVSRRTVQRASWVRGRRHPGNAERLEVAPRRSRSRR